MKKIKILFLLSMYSLTISHSSSAIWIGYDWNTLPKPADTNSPKEDLIKKQQESKKLQEQLYQLESSLFYKKHLSPMNIIRERAAFLIAVGGLSGSIITPFKMVKSNSGHPVTIFGTRLAVMATTLCATATVACAVSFFRPFLWYQEHQCDRLKKKIFELKHT